MSIPKKPTPVKLLVSLFSPDDHIISKFSDELSKSYGKMDYKSDLHPFLYTDYYCQEMGSPLCRRFITFDALILRNSLPAIKLKTNQMERSSANSEGKRRVNIDPGYISLENLILATGKNFIHRVYLEDGIYADLTLIFKKNSLRPLEWTYPDYRSRESIEIFNKIRENYRLQLKAEGII